MKSERGFLRGDKPHQTSIFELDFHRAFHLAKTLVLLFKKVLAEDRAPHILKMIELMSPLFFVTLPCSQLKPQKRATFTNMQRSSEPYTSSKNNSHPKKIAMFTTFFQFFVNSATLANPPKFWWDSFNISGTRDYPTPPYLYINLCLRLVLKTSHV